MISEETKYQAWRTLREVKDGKRTCFEAGLLEPLEFDCFEAEWQNYLLDLEKQLPKEKRKEIVLAGLRKRYARSDKKKKELLKEHDEKLTAGMSYKIRKEISNKLDIVKSLKEKTAKIGYEVKHQFERFQDLSWIQPDWKEEIESMGFEKWFKLRWWLSLVC